MATFIRMMGVRSTLRRSLLPSCSFLQRGYCSDKVKGAVVTTRRERKENPPQTSRVASPGPQRQNMLPATTVLKEVRNRFTEERANDAFRDSTRKLDSMTEDDIRDLRRKLDDILSQHRELEERVKQMRQLLDDDMQLSSSVKPHSLREHTTAAFNWLLKMIGQPRVITFIVKIILHVVIPGISALVGGASAPCPEIPPVGETGQSWGSYLWGYWYLVPVVVTLLLLPPAAVLL